MTLTLTVQPRQVTGKKVRALRANEQLPLVVYGRGKEARALQASIKDFRHILDQAGHTSLVDLVIEGSQPTKVLIHDVQQDPVSGAPLHADLLEVDLKKKITAEVPLVMVGEAPAVELLDGTLFVSQDTIEVECLPENLPKEIQVDISALKTFDDSITAAQVQLPAGVTLITDADVDIVFAQAQREEEAEEVSAEDAEKAAIEGMEQAAEAEKAAEAEQPEAKEE